MIAPAAETWLAPAKINLWLAILGRRDDGYHEVDTALQAIDLADTVRLEPGTAGGGVECRITGEWTDMVPSGEGNLAARAARMLAERVGTARGLRLTVAKRIPPGAGLGGGSSDAAATLAALARRWAVPGGEAAVRALAAEIGADVPFFLGGGTRRARGIGERLEPMKPPDERHGILVWPGVAVDTAWAYRAWDEAGGRTARAAEPGRNDLDTVVFDRFPAVRRAARALAAGDATVVGMTGSGSAVYALYADPALRDQDVARLREQIDAIAPGSRLWPFARVAHGVRPVEGGTEKGLESARAV